MGPAVKEVLDAVRQLSDDLAPVAKRVRLAESGFKVKEQRHALKVDLLEKRLQRLTSTLTNVQQERWLMHRSVSSNSCCEQRDESHGVSPAALGGPDVACAVKPPAASMSQSDCLASLESQVLTLSLGKFDAEKSLEHFKQEETYWQAYWTKKQADTAPAPGLPE